MGASKSKETSFQSRQYRINDDEMVKLESTFRKLVIKGHSDGFDEAKLKASISCETMGFFNRILSVNTTSNLCDLLAVSSKKIPSDSSAKNRNQSESIPFSSLLSFIDEFLNGSLTIQCVILTKLAAGQKDAVMAKEMHQFLTELIKSYFAIIHDTMTYKSWEAGVEKSDFSVLAHCLLIQLFYKDKMSKENFTPEAVPDLKFNADDIERWYRQTPIASKIVTIVFRMAFAMDDNDVSEKVEERHRQLLPLCTKVSWQKTHSIMSLPDILFLNQHLPSSLNCEWRYTFSSKQYGESFAQLLGKILNKGPTLLVIKDKEGGIFGGFASDSWKLQPQFAGTDSCFLFTLRPQLGMFPSTGYNDHYMYFNINQKTMPNGLGMGGQLEYFGLWLDREFGKGSCSKSCTTFESPQLSKSLDFSVDTVEVWAVGPEPKTEEEGTRSVLDKVDPELRAILEMTNRAPISDAIRDADKKITKEDSDNDV